MCRWCMKSVNIHIISVDIRRGLHGLRGFKAALLCQLTKKISRNPCNPRLKKVTIYNLFVESAKLELKIKTKLYEEDY